MKNKFYFTILLVTILLIGIGVLNSYAFSNTAVWRGCVPQSHEVRCRYVDLVLDESEYVIPDRVYKVFLFRGIRYTLHSTEVLYENSCTTVMGTIENEPVGYFYIVNCGNVYLIHIASPEGVFEIQHVYKKVYRIRELAPVYEEF